MLAERKRLLEKHPRTEEEEARLQELETKAAEVPAVDSPWEVKAMQLIRQAAENLHSK
jgi:hypothetical protein